MNLDVKIELPKDIVDRGLTLIQRLLEPGLQGLDFLSDKIRLVRYENAINTLAKASQFAEEHNVKLNPVDKRFLVPYLEKCSILQELAISKREV